MRREAEMTNRPAGEYESQFPAIYRFAYRLLGNSADAQDVAHDAFLALLSRTNGGGEIKNQRAWLYRVAANACCDRLRGRSVFQKIAGSWLEQRNVAATPEQVLLCESETLQVRTALNRLPVKKRLILLLRQEGLCYDEIAHAVGVRKSSLGKLLARATKQLAEELNEGDKT